MAMRGDFKYHDEIYADQMATVYRGRALWEPGLTNDRPQVEIGDVGHIFQGRFCRLFNVHLPSSDPSQSTAVTLPEAFETFPIVEGNVTTGVLNRGPHCSRSVRVFPFNTDSSVSWTPNNAEGLEFRCIHTNGAALYLPDDAETKDAIDRRGYRRYMLESVDAWCAMDDIQSYDLEREDIILVTGRDLAKSWLVVAFADEDFDASVQIGVQGRPGGNGIASGASVFWRNIRGAEVHWGPDANITISEPLGTLSQSQGPEATATSVQPSSTFPAGLPNRNQCVFLRGYRAKRRVPRRRDYDYDEPPNGLEIEIEDISDIQKHRELISALLDYILDNCEADIAIAHDDDLNPYLMEYEATTVEQVTDTLAKEKPRIILESSLTNGLVGAYIDEHHHPST